MRLTMPAFASDLVRDLRDRRLLPLALLLLAGVVAVPVLLSRSSGAAVPAPPAASSVPEGAIETQPAVLTEGVGIRDYRKRLEALKSSNPFAQRFAAPDVAGEAASLTPSLPTGGGGSATSAGGGSGASSQPVESERVPAPEPEVRFLTHRVDVKVGPEGDLDTREGVRALAVLPSRDTPVVSYLGTNEGGDRALFLVSGDVTAVDTDGRCMPSSADCQFLVLEEGERAKLDYGPDATTYVLRLMRINSVPLRDGANTADDKRPPLPG
jgi:hypothetical protein